MGRHRRLCPLLLAAGAAAASAQPPKLSHPAADPVAIAREPAKVSDAQLSLEVQVRISQQLDVSNLSALARSGVVTLDGKVRSEADRQRAGEIAREVPGVEDIANELTVVEPIVVALANEANAVTDRESTTIEIAVAAQLRSDPVLGSRAIRVVADDHTNTVTLTGTVSSEDEKEQAGRIAITAFPAGQVRNQIEVRQRL